MADRVKFPSWLYIRVDRPLRAALVGAAKAQGVTVSDLARRELRRAMGAADDEGSGLTAGIPATKAGLV